MKDKPAKPEVVIGAFMHSLPIAAPAGERKPGMFQGELRWRDTGRTFVLEQWHDPWDAPAGEWKPVEAVPQEAGALADPAPQNPATCPACGRTLVKVNGQTVDQLVCPNSPH